MAPHLDQSARQRAGAREKLAVVSDSLQIADRARRIESKTVDADARLPRVDRLYLALPLQGLRRLQSWKAAEPNVSREGAGGLDRAELAARIRNPFSEEPKSPR